MKYSRSIMSSFVRWYARLSMVKKVLIGSLIALIPSLIMAMIFGRQGWIARVSLLEVLAFALVMLGATAYLNYVSLRILFRPLFRLMETVSRLQEGDYRARAPDITMDRELARMGGILNLVLDNLNRSRKYTASKIMQALERERKRIARELHDETSQALTTLIINLEVAIDTLQDVQGVSEEQLEEVHSARQMLTGTRDLTENTLEEIRKLIFDLRPNILDDLGLIPAMRWYAMNKMEPVDITAGFDIQVDEKDRLPADTETALFRIFQEAVTNIIKHSRADQVTVRMKMNEESVALSVVDNGTGFDVQEAYDFDVTDSGLGLFGMQERAKLLGGECEIDSAPGEGTEVRLTIPRPSDVKRNDYEQVLMGVDG